VKREKLFSVAKDAHPDLGGCFQNPGCFNTKALIQELEAVYEVETRLMEYKRQLHSLGRLA
jgi:pyruvate/2-oxoglutarate dehydrogenase complex dihydrolipoamide dehydrogenase (E3) component